MTTTSDAAQSIDAHIPLRGCDIALPVMGLGTWAWGDKSTWGMNAYDRSYNFDTIREAYRASHGVHRLLARWTRQDRHHQTLRDRGAVGTERPPEPSGKLRTIVG